ncbi:MAG: AP2 domain-containing protein [Clostridia bacterium]
MVAKIDRTGETGTNNFGSKMVITKYRNARNIDVYFSEYNWTTKGSRYGNFKRGKVLCPYERRHYGVGYIGEGKYKMSKNGKAVKCYEVWIKILQRCYDDICHKDRPTYNQCEIYEKWLNYQNFAEWYYNNYYKIEGEKMALDKDILVKGNKIYSPDTCIFVPERINTLFIKCDNKRGNYPVGVSYRKRDKKFISQCNVYDFEKRKSQQKHLGYHETAEEAFKVYKQFKENYIKEVADYYKDKIPQKLYDAMYRYEVDIDD